MIKSLLHIKLSIGLILVLMVLGCTDSGNGSVTDTGIVYCSEGSPESFNPQLGTSLVNFDASARMLFNRLVTVDANNGTIIPSLAQSWLKSKDGLSYTFQLKKNVRFHTTQWFTPSRFFTAQDVLFSFDRQRNINHPFHEHNDENNSYFHSTGLADNLRDIEINGEHQVVFTLKKQDPSFLFYLTLEFASIQSAEYAETIIKNGGAIESFDINPIGTGPFVLKRYQTDAFIRYIAHPNYMHGVEKTKNIVFAITPDPSLRYARLISGECDVMAQPLSSHYALLKNNPELNVQKKAGLNLGYWAFNTQKEPFNNPLVRKALSYAINRKAILDTVFNGLGELSNAPLPVTMIPFHHTHLKQITYDPVLAKQLLAKAGYADGLEIEIWAIPIQRPYNPDGLLMAQLMQENLRQIGVKASIVSYNWSTFLKKVSHGEHQTALLGWVADNEDAGHFLSSLLSCDSRANLTNRSFYCNPDFDDLIKQAQRSSNINVQRELYYKAQEIFRQDLPFMPIGSGQSILAAHRTVKNLTIRRTGGISFSGVTKEVSK